MPDLKALPEKSALWPRQNTENSDGHGKLKITESASQVSKCCVFLYVVFSFEAGLDTRISVTESLIYNIIY